MLYVLTDILFFQIVISALLACSVAQVVYPGLPYASVYAPTYSYSSHGTPASTEKLEINPPTVVYHQPQPIVHHPYNLGFYPYAIPSAYPAAIPSVAAPAPAFVAQSPYFAAVEEVKETDEAEIVEADDSPVVPDEPVFLRNIFPVFDSDLRIPGNTIRFVRPDQVRPVETVAAEDEGDEQEDPALQALIVNHPSLRTSPVVSVDDLYLRSIFPVFNTDLRTAGNTVSFARPDQVRAPVALQGSPIINF